MRILLLSAVLSTALFSCKKNGTDPNAPEPIPHNKALVWNKNYGGTQYDYINHTIQLSNGDFATAGTTRSTDGDIGGGRIGYDYWITKIGNNGNLLWSKTFGTNQDEHGTAVAATSDGGLLMVGYMFENFRNHASALKVDANGQLVWEKKLSNSPNAKPLAITATGDGGFVVAGYQSGDGSDLEAWVLKLNGDGNVAWSKTFGGAGEDQFQAVTKLADGGFVLAGFTKSSGGTTGQNKGGADAWILKIDGNGNRAWSSNWGGSSDDLFKAVTPTSDGGIIAVGHAKSNNGDINATKGGDEAFIVKFDASGNKTWTKTYGGLNEELIVGVAPTSDGGCIIAGHSNSTTGDVARMDNDWGVWIVKTDASGNKTATSTYGGRRDEFIAGIIPTTDGGFLISGVQDTDNRGYDGLLVKIGAL